MTTETEKSPREIAEAVIHGVAAYFERKSAAYT
jgi:hypothetical protein